MYKYIFLLFLLPLLTNAQKSYQLKGVVSDEANGSPLISAYVDVLENDITTITDFQGKYSINLKPGTYTLNFKYSGYEEQKITVNIENEDKKLDVALKSSATQLDEVLIEEKKNEQNIKSVEMSTAELTGEQIKKVPALLGEADVIRSIQSLPGVSTVGEGATGFNVRGGGIDQNLVLMDRAPVFNSSHLFGFFSVFNPDVVENVKLIKGGIPSKYGGRLSSILDVELKQGNPEKFKGEGGIGLLFSRLALETPIIKDKASIIVAGRRSYADVLAKPFLNDDLSDAQFYFYDFSAKVNVDFSEKDKLYLSGYIGRDVFGAGFKFNWGNSTSTLRWKHIYNDQWFSNVTAYYSNYGFEIGVGDEGSGGFQWNGNIVNYSLQADWNYYINDNNTLNFGAQSILYQFKPGNSVLFADGGQIDFSQDERFGVENAVFVDNEQKIGKGVVLKYGLRGSNYFLVGPGPEYVYGERSSVFESRPLLEERKAETGEGITAYYNLEPRFSAKFPIDSVSSIKLSYNRMAQYIHLMSNTAAATPLDVYSPTTNNIKPQLADQVAVGYFRNFGKKLEYETSVEVYYKYLQNQIGYIPTAELVLNNFYEGDLLFGEGRAYGTEFFIKKNTGKLNGWISYTLSRTEIQIPEINNGDYYPQRFDRPHVLNIVLNYELTKRWELSANFIYNSGVPATFPTNRFEIQNINISQNPSNTFNNTRVPDFHRLDLSATLHGKKLKKDGGKKWLNGDLVFSVYNAYNRMNAFTVYLQPGDEPKAIQYSIIGSIVPAITYNFKF